MTPQKTTISPEQERRFKHFLTFRLLVIVLGFGLVTFYQVCLEPVFWEASHRFLYSLLGVYLVFGISTFLWAGQRLPLGIRRRQIVVDLIFQGTIVWATGGVLSIFSPLLFVTLVAATGIISLRGSFVLATVVTGVLALTTLLHAVGYTPLPGSRLGFSEDDTVFLVTYLVASVFGLYALSALGSRFASGLHNIQSLQSEILQNMAQGLLAVDPHGRVVTMNREAARLLEVNDCARHRCVSELFRGERFQSLHQAFSATGTSQVEVKFPASTGHDRPLNLLLSDVFGANGKLRYKVCLISDLTLKHQKEEAEQKLRKLRDLHVMALGIAHEIRNPLASIRGCVQEIGKMEGLDESKRKLMNIVCRESDRLDQTIEEFLAFARSGPVKLVPVDVKALIDDTVLLLRSREEFEGRQISWEPPPGLVQIHGDRNRLVQVFLNLGLNAIEATCRANGEIRFHLKTPKSPESAALVEADAQPFVVVEVGDNGEGMTSEVREKLFAPYFSTKVRGGGLGLAVVEQIIQEHHGTVEVRSQEGSGTSFRLVFPGIPMERTQRIGNEKDACDVKAAPAEMECHV